MLGDLGGVVGREDVEQLEDDVAGGAAREDGADGAVEIEQEAARACEQLRDVGDGRGCHSSVSRLMVLQMVSNQVCICSTYWEPVEVSSSLVAWWKSVTSLPMR